MSIRTSTHRTVTYVYLDDELVGSAEFDGRGPDTGPWVAMIGEADNTGTVVSRHPDRESALVALGSEITRRSMAKTVVEVLTGKTQ